MSQIIKTLTSGGPIPPNIPTTFQAQNNGVPDGSATPALNTINFNATDVTTNNVTGIEVTASGSTVTYELTNRIHGTATTTDDTTLTQVLSFSLGATPSTYLFEHRLVAFNDTQDISAGYHIFQVYRTDGITATKISGAPGIIAEETDMTNGLSQFTESGNNIVVNVMGINTDTIRWYALTTYIKVE